MQPTKDNKKQELAFSLVELTEILIKHQELHEGLYNLSVEFKIAVGGVGPAEEPLPGGMIGVSRIGISKAEKDKVNIHTVDASKVNPTPKNIANKK